MRVGCGLPAWIGEAEQREGGSPARKRQWKQGVKVSSWKRKAETGEMWLLLRGRGGKVDISVEAGNFKSVQRKN